ADDHVRSPRPGCNVALTECQCPPRCANCDGLHAATEPTCPARPVNRDGQTVRISAAKLVTLRRDHARQRAQVHRCPGAPQNRSAAGGRKTTAAGASPPSASLLVIRPPP